MSMRTKTSIPVALALAGALLTTPLAVMSAQEAESAQEADATTGTMEGMQGMKPGMMPMGSADAKAGMMSPQMMQQRQAMMQQHMSTMETHMANIEALLRELVELNKAKQ